MSRSFEATQEKNMLADQGKEKAMSAASGGALAAGSSLPLAAAKLAAGKAAGAPWIALAAATEVAGPAGFVAVGGQIVGGAGGSFIGEAVAGETGGKVGQELGEVGGAVGTAAGVGALMAGPPGAAAGAVVGAVGWGASKAVQGFVEVSQGVEGGIRITNESPKPAVFYSYDKNDVAQFVSYASIELEPGAAGTISATEGMFRQQCETFYIHSYVKETGMAGKYKRKATSGYGQKVDAHTHYGWNGTRLCKN